jgi:rRNA processing protein Gar1
MEQFASHDIATAPSTTKPDIPAIGIALYDFKAERFDELSIQQGDTVFLLAQTEGWYLAKPMSEAHEPGLVPATYVDVRHPETLLGTPSSASAIAQWDPRTAIPTIAEWKESRPKLIRLQTGSRASSAPNPSLNAIHGGKEAGVPIVSLVNGLVTANVFRYYRHPLSGMYIYEVDVMRQQGRDHRILRTYEDFFGLHRQLLDSFPAEAGRSGKLLLLSSGIYSVGGRRILPFFPAPVPEVTEIVAQRRQNDIHNYVQKILVLSSRIRRSGIVLEFFKPWPETDTPVPFLVDETPIDNLHYNPMVPTKRKQPSFQERPIPHDTRRRERRQTHQRSLPPRLRTTPAQNYLDMHPMMDGGQQAPLTADSDGAMPFSSPSRPQSTETIRIPNCPLATLPESMAERDTVITQDALSNANGEKDNVQYGQKKNSPSSEAWLEMSGTVAILQQTMQSKSSSELPEPHAAETVVVVDKQKPVGTATTQKSDIIQPVPKPYVKIKLVEQDGKTSYFKVFRNIGLMSLKDKLMASLGIPTDRVLFYRDERAGGQLMPLTRPSDFQAALQRCDGQVLTLHA